MNRDRQPLLLGLDVGTTNVKAVVCTPDGTTLALASVPQETSYPRPGWASHNPERIWELCCTVLREVTAAAASAGTIFGLAVASMGEAGVSLDRNGRPTHDVIAWFDRRTVPQTDAFAAQIDPDALFAITGTELQPILTAPKLMWLRENEPDAWARTERFLNVSAYVAHRLGAAPAQDYSLASRTGLFDLRTLEWDDRLLGITGLDRALFGELNPGGTKIGVVSADAASETGLPVGAAIGLAGHDHLCGAFAAGVVRHGVLLDSIGTAEGLMIGIDQPLDDVSMGKLGLCQGAHVVPDLYYLFGAVYTAGASYEWARDAIGGHRGHEELLAGARAVPPGSLGAMFLPHLRLALFPKLDSRARGAFVGLTTDTTAEAMIRAVLEGIALEARAGWLPLARFAGLNYVDDIKIIGGTARNQLLIEIKAAVMNARLHVLEIEEATALGAAMLGGMAAEVYASAVEAADAVRFGATVVEPADPHVVALYDTLYEDAYRHLYEALAPMNHRAFDLFTDSREA